MGHEFLEELLWEEFEELLWGDFEGLFWEDFEELLLELIKIKKYIKEILKMS